MNRKKNYIEFKIKDSDSAILYAKSDIAYTLAFLITKSKSKAKLLETECIENGIAWFQLNDVNTANLSKVENTIYKELNKVKLYIEDLENTNFNKLKDIANNKKLIKNKSYQLMHTELYYDLALIYKNNNWYVDFTTKEYPKIDTV